MDVTARNNWHISSDLDGGYYNKEERERGGESCERERRGREVEDDGEKERES